MKRLCSIILAMTMALMVTPEPQPEPPMTFDGFTAHDFIVPIPDDFVRPTPTPAPEMPADVREFKSEMDELMSEISILVTEMVILDEYHCFITAYCAEECGWNYWTSSGAYCHRSSWEHRIDEPTTCAIDLKYFDYGDLFYIPSEDRIFIAEDTGAFRGLWLDLYQDDMSDVRGYNTRYETIYVVTFESHLEPSSNYDIHKFIKEKMTNAI